MMKKKIVGAVFATMLMAQGQHEIEASNHNAVTAQQNVVYRVYINDEAVGIITDKEEYTKFVEQVMEDLLKEYSDQIVYPPSNVRLEEEVTLLPITNVDNSKVLKIVEEKGDFKTSVNQIKIGEISFATNQADKVQDILMELMAFYTGKDNLALLMDQDSSLEPLSETGSQYVGAKIVEEIKVEETTAAPEDVLSEEQLRSMIMYGETEPVKTVVFDQDSSLYYIARDNGLTEEELYLLNPGIEDLKWSELLGKEIDVTPLNPIVTIETEKESVSVKEIAYETEYIEDSSMLKGETSVKQEGQTGEFLTRTQTKYVNGEKVESNVLEETQLSEPVNKVVIKGTKVVTGVGTGNFVWPTTSRSVTCGYLCYSGHYAIDISAYVGQPVYAADSGVVVSASYDGAYGYSILINHKNGYYTRYSHLSTLNVSAGQTVQAGQTIAAAGNTGNSTGPHLHFEIRTNTGSQPSYAPNPMDFY
ncbi:MAG TPA: peptidase M23 [Firmicutes bacterium]|nr:peptidase M23 [Bacillota bacterium]